MSLQTLPVKTLVKVLAKLRGGEIGFDPFRDPRTSKKEALLAFILQNHDNQAIINATEAVMQEQAWLSAHPYNRAVLPPSPATPATPATDDAQALAALLAKLTKPSVDEAALKRLVQRQFEDENEVIRAHYTRAEESLRDLIALSSAALDAKIAEFKAPLIVKLQNPDTKEIRDLGLAHQSFPTLLKMAQARTQDGDRLNIWLKGPAGSGKTTAARKVAQALELAFHFNGAISTEYELMGFKDASGTYHRTAFREAFEHGGVYLFDEIDSSLPKAVLAFNAALGNGLCNFPDQQITRHKDCVILAGANTAGNGATSDYVGRMKQDLAFLNRFVLLDWPLDEALEESLASNQKWVKRVQKIREKAHERGIKGHIISPRATFYGEALLAVGLDQALVEHAVLKGALSNEQWGTLCQ